MDIRGGGVPLEGGRPIDGVTVRFSDADMPTSRHQFHRDIKKRYIAIYICLFVFIITLRNQCLLVGMSALWSP